MKQTILFICFILLATLGRAQNIDSILAEPQTIELTISTPQPRLKETFQISLDINHLRANIFKSLAGKVQLSNDISATGNGELTINVNAIKKGKSEIGPLEFFLDKTKYTTNKIAFEVIDSLPNTDKGVWFRKVMTSETTFCIIIEQRIPANSKTTKKSDNSITFTTEPEYTDIVKFKDSYSIDGVSGGNSHSRTDFSTVTIHGEVRQFMYGYSVYYFNIEDKKSKIKITKDKFLNMPDDYRFEDIVIQ
ncbi:MAG: hypothetical protein HZA79_13065 [Sphingobacteriales bacterium]|nr:hypothetical protein [Sphingobacteriales bacterium]